MGTLELSHNSHGIGHRTKVRRGPCGLFHSDLLLDIAGQLRITRALYRYLHDAQDISSERRSGRHVVEMLRSTSRARCIPTRDLPRVHEGVERRMGARDVVAQCCGVRAENGGPRRTLSESSCCQSAGSAAAWPVGSYLLSGR